MSERTARKYERVGKLPSQRHRVLAPGERDPILLRKTGLGWSNNWSAIRRCKGPRCSPCCVRSIPVAIVKRRSVPRERHIREWKALHGPEQEVIFEQVHTPGERMQSDFTHMEELSVTLAGEAFPHLLFHSVLTYSNVEAVSICFSETFEALSEGIEHALWQFAGVPVQHRTDHLSAAVKALP